MQFTFDELVAHGVAIGLANLSVQSVAVSLGVTPAAVYRRVKSRLELETLVGEAILAKLVIAAEDDLTAAQYLVTFAMQLRAFCLANPGVANYMQQVFPRGEAGVALLMAGIAAMEPRGHDIHSSIILLSSTASITVGLVIGQENQSQYFDKHGWDNPDAVAAAVMKPAALLQAEPLFSAVTHAQYFEFLISAVVDGLLAHLPAETNTADWLIQRLATLKGQD